MQTLPRVMASLVIICIAFTVSAQKAPAKFGKIDIDDLKMTSYEPDTSAVAVILCQYGYFDANNFSYTFLRRIKILKPSGMGLCRL